jgi:hypothetical protein
MRPINLKPQLATSEAGTILRHDNRCTENYPPNGIEGLDALPVGPTLHTNSQLDAHRAASQANPNRET